MYQPHIIRRMNRGLSRRAFLAATTGAALAPVGVDAVAANGACEDYAELRARVDAERDSLTQLEAERERLLTEIAAFRASIDAGRNRARGTHPYDEATREAARDVGLAARPGVVFLEMVDGYRNSEASAWFVDDHLLLTNNHNVEGLTPSSSRTFWTLDGERHEFEVVDRSETGPDIALLRTDTEAPAVLPTGSSAALSPGDRLVQVGNPGGFGKWVLALGGLVKQDESFGDLVTTVPGLTGVSGSPLLDMAGRVVGVTFGARSGSNWEPGQAPEPAPLEAVSYPLAPTSNALHVPIEDALELVEDWT